MFTNLCIWHAGPVLPPFLMDTVHEAHWRLFSHLYAAHAQSQVMHRACITGLLHDEACYTLPHGSATIKGSARWFVRPLLAADSVPARLMSHAQVSSWASPASDSVSQLRACLTRLQDASAHSGSQFACAPSLLLMLNVVGISVIHMFAVTHTGLKSHRNC